MEALQTLELHRVPHSIDLEKPGDFAFVSKREPIREITRTPVDPPTGFLRTLWWTMFGKKYIEKETVLPLWPEYDVVVMMCPHCNQPIGTTKEHHIVSTEPLTIQQPLACAYSRPTLTALPTIAFQIKDGKIMPA
jgi:hypothetical protein